MADVSRGPVATLPGHHSASPNEARCDDHPDRPAAGRIQGETDSFGAEYHDLCAECIETVRKHMRENRSGVCDWCGKEADDLRHRRDFDEGMAGPVYRVCGKCVDREMEEYRRALKNDYYDDCYEADA